MCLPQKFREEDKTLTKEWLTAFLVSLRNEALKVSPEKQHQPVLQSSFDEWSVSRQL